MSADNIENKHSENLLIIGSNLIGTCEAGKIYRKKLCFPHHSTFPVAPEEILALIGYGTKNGEHNRRGLSEKMVQNSPNPMPMISKPSSIFIFIDRSKNIYFDYLVESPNFHRSGTVHHEFMVQFDESSENYHYHPANLLSRDSMWSGHATALLPPHKSLSYSYLALLDKFSKLGDPSKTDNFMIRALYENCTIPVTSRGQIIPPIV